LPQADLFAGRWTTGLGRCGEHGAVGSRVGTGYGELMSTGLVIGLVVLGIIVWLATSGVWMILKRVGHATPLDEPVDRFFDVEGELDPADYIKFKDQHHRDGHG